MNRRRNTLIVVAALALIVIVGFFASRHGAAAMPVREVVVHYGAFRTKLPETGVVQLPRSITIPASAAGNLGLIEVHAGERVAAGQLLATIINDQLISNLHDAQDNVLAAQGKAQSVSETNGVLPEQNRSAVLQAQANLVAARSALTQARQDLVAGAQSGLGYGGQTAQEQRLAADTALAKAQTDLGEAKRTYDANQYLYAQKGISRDLLMQSKARYDEAQATYDQARSERQILGGTLARENAVLSERVRSAQDSLRESEAALASARASASESKAGDLQSARADSERAAADLAFAQRQVARLQVTAPLAGVIESVASQPGDSLRPVQPGDAVTAGQALFTMAADERYIVRTKVDEQDIAAVRAGQRAVVSGEDFGTATLGGRVVSISPIAQKSDDPSNTSRQVLTTIALDRTLPFLRDGMTVDVDIVTHDQPHVLTVPTDAVRKDDRGNYVFVVDRGRATRTAVKLGAQNDTQVVVLSGLHAGNIVVDDKAATVAANDRVTPAPSPSPVTSAGP
ncbi:MAG: efflux RND transporter periplasmic adaptor subunit [Candidatus Eremiobacteraeota bacterium]|nr:efflux RND transporter periplasmic adaptor subunit [Candidatus Eremiobacteraeota bacterium]MBC5802021.1 efflux RND transporter periplasmic adaptor subunit [Candidatus Eremiobacteraeota bacterium]MBC5822575.1 efflux RND transporter periplasmic adaptor subunit [Candidatus Eremiobacteraeota bacterium]